MNSEYGLVMEGGGFRGCYTAGALKWLNDQDIHFSYTVAISAASCYELFYSAEMDDVGKRIAIDGVKDKGVLGIRPLLYEGGIVGVGYLKDKYCLPRYAEALEKIKKESRMVEVGLFNMDKECLEYYGTNDFDDNAEYFKASCVLPLTGKMTEVNGQRFLDGGIRTMISIERAEATGHKKNLVIVTKDKNYVRKPNGWAVDTLLKIVFRKFPKMLKTLDGRVETYYKEMAMVAEAEEKGNALLIRPSKDTGVKRFSGSKEQMEEMYQLGYQDMEDRKDDIFRFLEIEQ